MKFILAASLILAVLLCSVQCHPEPLTVTLSTDKEFKVGQDIICKVTITNNLDEDIHLLKRNTPLDGLTAAIFAVTHDGKPLPYEGLLFKWLSPTDEDYVSISLKSSISSSVDLSVAYGFRAAGIYSVKMSTNLHYFAGNAANSSSQQISSNTAVFFLGESSFPPKLTLARSLRRDLNSTQKVRVGAPRAPSFGGSGTSKDKSSSVTAYNTAYNLLSTCYRSVSSNPTLYTKWFGNSYYSDTVKGVYLDIKSAMETKTFTLYFYGPECRRGVVAYTYHGATTLYLCDGYISAPTTGSDSKMGTIIHEMSHAVAYTEDYEYGETDCQTLARTKPSKAVNNADNYEYFAEALQ